MTASKLEGRRHHLICKTNGLYLAEGACVQLGNRCILYFRLVEFARCATVLSVWEGTRLHLINFPWSASEMRRLSFSPDKDQSQVATSVVGLMRCSLRLHTAQHFHIFLHIWLRLYNFSTAHSIRIRKFHTCQRVCGLACLYLYALRLYSGAPASQRAPMCDE